MTEPLTFAIIPDTQNLVRYAPRLYARMTSWLVEHAPELDLKLVVHLGDVVDRRADRASGLRLAHDAHEILLRAGIRLLITCGNHDYDDFAAQTGLTQFNTEVGAAQLEPYGCYEDTFEAGAAENCWTAVDHGGHRFLFVLIEYMPRPSALDWAERVIAAHPDHLTVVITHAYTDPLGDRTTNGTDSRLDGEQIWQRSLRRHPNLIAVFSGHKVGGQVAHRVDVGDAGNEVLNSFQNWQMVDEGGAGRVRIVRIDPTTCQLSMTVVNTSTGTVDTTPGYQVEITLGRDRQEQSP